MAAATLNYEVLALEGTTVAAATATQAAIAAGVGGAAAGAISTGTWRGALIGGLEAAAFSEVGSLTDGHFGDSGLNDEGETPGDYLGTTNGALNVLGHAAVGCVAAAAGGSSCGAGAAGGGLGDIAGLATYNQGLTIALAASSVAGGVGSVLGGGKFENGAETAAFGYLFNATAHQGLSFEVPGFVSTAIDWLRGGEGLTPNSFSFGVVVQFPTPWEADVRPDIGVYTSTSLPGADISKPSLDVSVTEDDGFGLGTIHGTFDGVSNGTTVNTPWGGYSVSTSLDGQFNGFTIKAGPGLGVSSGPSLTGAYTARDILKGWGFQ